MEKCPNNPLWQSLTAQQLTEFIQARREKWAKESDLSGLNDLEDFEQKLHELVMALESELMSEELAEYDVTAEEIEVEGQVYQRGGQTAGNLSHRGRSGFGGTPFVLFGHDRRGSNLSSGMAGGDHRGLFHATGGAAGGLCHGPSDPW